MMLLRGGEGRREYEKKHMYPLYITFEI